MLMLVFLACSSSKPADTALEPLSPDTDGPVDTGDGPTEPPRTLSSGAYTLEHGGLQRRFRLYRPASLADDAPLVVVLHGYGDSATAIEGYAGLNAVADREGFAVVYPQGTTDEWGQPYWEVGYAFTSGEVDDVGFVRAITDWVSADLGLVGAFATGMSNGGDMSYRLACEADDLFVAVAPVAGCLMDVLRATCAPSHEPSVLEIHGTEDSITRWEGDMDNSDGWGPYLGTEETVGHFVSLYGLEPAAPESLPDVADDGRSVIAHRWSGAASGAEVWLYEVVGGGHEWPGSAAPRDIVAAEEIWSFFQRRPPVLGGGS